jgi:hypothetical protein
MLDTFGNFFLTTLMVVVAPALLAFAIAFGMFQYRRRSPRTKQRTEEATKELYRSGDQQEQRNEEPLSR